MALFSADLLPDWFDAWLEPAAEEWRHLRVNALEAQSQALLTRARLHEAAAAARRAIDVDPLRQTAQRCLITVHVAAATSPTPSAPTTCTARASPARWGSSPRRC
ncbi:hypothetical protein BC477_03645 [Clavibacter michiganensis subsp. michiganensis]|uniref:Bacterial transcriptional activator domain-containing protein n=1 Tax=Clavibacter michiganensis subsp. michiganensis TaxID=33013 RepID=A0A251XJV4_CLAMM|nr:hypothetical protein BC477_03645 [Clavibacter michiganensis subsp. michiganensis]OUE03805.1 hypothetical protein CMMCAS07_02580 [Clavibacter michiganensis subsp. michiganensis]